MISRLIKYRFELFLVSQVAILFGSLIIPSAIAEAISSILFYLNVIIGCFLIGNNKKFQLRLIILFSAIGGVFVVSPWIWADTGFLKYAQFILFFVFHLLITYHIIRLLWYTREVDKTIIFGMMSGYISLGFLGFFIFMSLELINPGSFSGLTTHQSVNPNIGEPLMYFSYITLMTIGYGEILPITSLAQKAAILIGLIGQFYLIIITGIIVGKFLNQNSTLNR